MRNLLCGRGVRTTILCPICLHDVEHLLHIFLDCNFAKERWKSVRLEFDSTTVESCSDWLLHILNTKDNAAMIKVATVLWGIWSSRTMKIWEHKTVTPVLTMHRSSQQINQWREAQSNRLKFLAAGNQTVEQGVTKWVAPVEDFLTVNVGASLKQGTPSL